MGWYTLHKPAGVTYADFLQQEIFGDTWRIVEHATKQRVFYCAAKQLDTGKVYGFVILLTLAPRSYSNFGYKEICESMGPGERNAPARVIDALSPLEALYEPKKPGARDGSFEWARDWRAACRAQLAKPRPRKGDCVTFASPITFTNGQSLAVFTYSGRGNRFTAASDKRTYSISRWCERNYSVESTQ